MGQREGSKRFEIRLTMIFFFLSFIIFFFLFS